VKLGLCLALLAALSCKPAPAPAPVASVSSEAVYNALVDAGCMAPAGDGPDAVAEEGAKASPPGWLTCMFNGGSVGDCETPCR
jgi:hypothetical protein